MKVIVPKESSGDLRAGIYLAKVTRVRYLEKDEKLLEDSKGNVALEITFEDQESGNDHREVFWWKEDLLWRITKLMKTLGIDITKKHALSSDILGKKLWIAIREIVDRSTGEITYGIFEFKKSNKKGDNRPHMVGDPEESKDGEPSDKFYIEIGGSIENMEEAPDPEESEEDGF